MLDETVIKLSLNAEKAHESTTKVIDNQPDVLIVPEIPKDEPEIEIPDSGVEGNLPTAVLVTLFVLLVVLLGCLIQPFFKKRSQR